MGELQEEEKWVRNPLLFEVNENMAIEVGEQLIELQSNNGTCMEFGVTQNLADPRAKQIESSPLSSKTALEILVPFRDHISLRDALSTLLHIKTKSEIA